MSLRDADGKLQESFIKAIERHQNYTVSIEMTVEGTFSLISQLQLALRHPSNCGLSAAMTREFVDSLIEKLPEALLRDLAQKGYHAEFDVRDGR